MQSPPEAIAAALDTAHRDGVGIKRLLVAFSGGVDSSVLLSATLEVAAQSGLLVSAIHFDHGWSPASPRWAAHCVEVAATLGVDCAVERFDAPRCPGESREALGRALRYAALEKRVAPGTVVMTAHHADDLAETFLLMALRGSGPQGLAAIAPGKSLGAGWLLRPFLDLSRAELEAHASARGLAALDDPSNADEAIDRNYLRRHVMPAVFQRWVGARDTLRRAARLQHEAAGLLEHAARLALADLGASRARLPLAGFNLLSPPLQRLVLRHWINEGGLAPPAAAQLEWIRARLPAADLDRNPLLRWPGGGVRRYDNALWIDDGREPLPAHPDCRWSPPASIDLAGGRLEVRIAPGEGLSPSKLAGLDLCLRARRGGERLRLPGHLHHKTLKHLWQEARVPPWQRLCVPLVYAGERLVAVPSIGVAAEFAANQDEPGWAVHWLPGAR